jgi:hypothetical protein
MEYSPFFLFRFYFVFILFCFIKRQSTQNWAVAKVLSQRRMRCAYPTYKACKPQRTTNPIGRMPQAASDRKITRDTY